MPERKKLSEEEKQAAKEKRKLRIKTIKEFEDFRNNAQGGEECEDVDVEEKSSKENEIENEKLENEILQMCDEKLTKGQKDCKKYPLVATVKPKFDKTMDRLNERLLSIEKRQIEMNENMIEMKNFIQYQLKIFSSIIIKNSNKH